MGEIFTEGVADKVLVEEYATLVRVTFEVDAEHVIDFAFLDFCTGVKVRDGRDTCQKRYTYWGNGILMNRLPLIKKLRLREVLTLRGLWGSLSDKNNPLHNTQYTHTQQDEPALFLFPADVPCLPMGKRPYMEAGVGIDNIDVAAANARGITVARVPDYGAEIEVADHAVALFLAVPHFRDRKRRAPRAGKREEAKGDA